MSFPKPAALKQAPPALTQDRWKFASPPLARLLQLPPESILTSEASNTFLQGKKRAAGIRVCSALA